MMALAFSGGKDSMACLHLLRAELECAIYVDTGLSYPETERLVDYAESIMPVHRVCADRVGQNARHGIPSDVVPINYTTLGQLITGTKSVMVQSYLQCCWENISQPLLAKAKELGVTHLVYGQRDDETHKSISRNGDMVDGIVRVQPIEQWTRQQVLDFIAKHMPVPEHYRLNHSSLDCYDCTAFSYESRDRVAWTKDRYPEFYAAYRVREQAIQTALIESGGIA